MKAGSRFLFLIAAAIFAVEVLAEADENSEKFSKASCNFTLNLLKHVETKYSSSNIIFSPASISILLAILQQGAKGNTLDQLEKVLSLTAEESRKGFDKFTSLKEEKNVELEWGNRCYVTEGLKLDEGFQKSVKNGFDVGVEELNFRSLPPKEAADKINKWVSGVTHDKITDLVDPSTLSPETIMLLINAIYFKGNWLRPFKKAKTSEDKFEIAPESSVETLYMSQRGKFYSDKDSYLGAKWIQMPFQHSIPLGADALYTVLETDTGQLLGTNDRFAMIFVLPTRKHRLSQLVGKLTSDDLHQIFSHRGVSQVKIRIPKFKLSEKVSLVETLQGLGLTDVFSGASDLRGLTSTSESIQVSEIIHQANVEIDEKGSSSSAATVVQFLRMRTPTLSFVADQPFLFFIVDVESKIPLFAGKVVNPKS